jgi:hypothetical protein
MLEFEQKSGLKITSDLKYLNLEKEPDEEDDRFTNIGSKVQF